MKVVANCIKCHHAFTSGDLGDFAIINGQKKQRRRLPSKVRLHHRKYNQIETE